MTVADPRRLLRAMFDAAVAAAQPALCLPRHLPPPPKGRTVVVGAGKASAAMARALENHWPGPLEGLVVTRYGHAEPCTRIEIVEATHPVPDDAGVTAARRMLRLVGNLGPDDLVIGLFSGGGSALLTLPPDGASLADKQAVNRALLGSGATIGEMNCVRRHISAIKGGRLAAACAPARLVNLLLSDVPGDAPVDIASGPTVVDPSTRDEALAILARYGIALPRALEAYLRSDAGESIKALASVETRLVATPRLALEAAVAVAGRAGIAAHVLGDAIEGRSREVGMVMAGMARSVVGAGTPFAPPCILLSGGETTVEVRDRGRGGRNAEFLLALALGLDGCPGVHAVAADTDGIDGTEPIAGAFIGPDTLARAVASGVDPRRALDDNDAHTFFERLGDSLISGPTRTNVNDFRAILIDA